MGGADHREACVPGRLLSLGDFLLFPPFHRSTKTVRLRSGLDVCAHGPSLDPAASCITADSGTRLSIPRTANSLLRSARFSRPAPRSPDTNTPRTRLAPRPRAGGTPPPPFLPARGHAQAGRQVGLARAAVPDQYHRFGASAVRGRPEEHCRTRSQATRSEELPVGE